MKLIDQKTKKYRTEQTKIYYYDDLGGLKGMADVLRGYELDGYLIKNISILVDSDHSDPYLGTKIFFSVDEFLDNVPILPSTTQTISSLLEKEQYEYLIAMSSRDNSIEIYPPNKKVVLGPVLRGKE